MAKLLNSNLEQIMNKGVFFICVWLLIGCSNKKDFAPLNESTAIESAPAIIIENAYSLLIQEKIQDHIDKQKLKQQNPDYKLSTDSITTLYIEDKATIQAIKLLDTITLEDGKATDIRTVIIYDTNKRDTIIATLQRSKVTIEDEDVVSSKVILKDYQK
jgi:hypothetical protein